MPASPLGSPAAEARRLLTTGIARGFTVLCLGEIAALLSSIVASAGPTGLVVVAGEQRAETRPDRHALRCSAEALPLRSHVVDAAVVIGVEVTDGVTAEVRRALVPGGDARFLLVRPASDALFEDAGLSIRERVATADGDVVVVRGP
jgi:hypothetical protein